MFEIPLDSKCAIFFESNRYFLTQSLLVSTITSKLDSYNNTMLLVKNVNGKNKKTRKHDTFLDNSSKQDLSRIKSLK